MLKYSIGGAIIVIWTLSLYGALYYLEYHNKPFTLIHAAATLIPPFNIILALIGLWHFWHEELHLTTKDFLTSILNQFKW